MARKQQSKRTPAPFTYESGRTKITGKDDHKWLLFLCTLHSLRWYLVPLIGGASGAALWHWIFRLLSG